MKIWVLSSKEGFSKKIMDQAVFLLSTQVAVSPSTSHLFDRMMHLTDVFSIY